MLPPMGRFVQIREVIVVSPQAYATESVQVIRLGATVPVQDAATHIGERPRKVCDRFGG